MYFYIMYKSSKKNIGSLYGHSIEYRNVTGMVKYIISIHFIILQNIFKSLVINIANKKKPFAAP